jgi:hypothetical protein
MKRTVALLTCLALMIPGAAVASANSTNDSYGQSGVHNVSASKNACANGAGSSSGTAGSGSSSSGSAGASSGSASGANCADTGPISATTSTGSLPFTGLDLGALGAGAAVLLGAGVLLRRFSAAKH